MVYSQILPASLSDPIWFDNVWTNMWKGNQASSYESKWILTGQVLASMAVGFSFIRKNFLPGH